MTVCCTPMVRLGKWQVDFHRPGAGDPEINIDQSKNLLEVERGNDLLAALCIAYAFDKALCQPLVTIIGYQEKEHPDDDDDSLGSYEDPPKPQYPMLMAPPNEDEEDDEEFEPAGYLGYEDPEAPDDDEPEITGYLETDPYSDNADEIEPAGYIEGDDDGGSADVEGYLESGDHRGPQGGYLANESFHDEH